MAATAVPAGRQNTNYSIQAAAHYGLQIEVGLFTPSTSYTTNGDAVTFNMGSPDVVFVQPVGGYQCVWNSTGAKMKILVAAGTETTDATDLGTATMLNTPYIALKWGSR